MVPQCGSASVPKCNSITEPLNARVPMQQCASALVSQCSIATLHQYHSATVSRCRNAIVPQCNSALKCQCTFPLNPCVRVEQCYSVVVGFKTARHCCYPRFNFPKLQLAFYVSRHLPSNESKNAGTFNLINLLSFFKDQLFVEFIIGSIFRASHVR